MRYCNTAEDEAGAELTGRQQLLQKAPPVADAATQKACCERLSRRRAARPEKNDSMATKVPVRPLDYQRLSELAVPREAPEPPCPEAPAWKPLPLPPKLKVQTQSAPRFASLFSEGLPTPPGQQRTPQPLRPEGFSSLAELRCHVVKDSMAVAAWPSSRNFMRDLSEPILSRPRRRPTMEMQQRYTEQKLYSKPKVAQESISELEARLEQLRQENQGPREERRKERDKRQKKEARRAAKRAAAMRDDGPLPDLEADQGHSSATGAGEPRPIDEALC